MAKMGKKGEAVTSFAFVKTSMKLIGAVGAGLLLLGQGGVGMAQKAKSATPDLAAQRKAARAEGLPLTPVDLKRNPPVPDEENAAFAYQQIMGEMENLPDWEERTKQLDQWLLGERVEQGSALARKFAADTAPFLARIEAATRLPNSEFYRDYTEGEDTTDTNYRRLRALLIVLLTQVRVQSADSSASKAMQTMGSVARLTQHLHFERTPVALELMDNFEVVTLPLWMQLMQRTLKQPDGLANARAVAQAFGTLPNMAALYGSPIFGSFARLQRMRQDHRYHYVVTTEQGKVEIDWEDADATEARALDYARKANALLLRFSDKPTETAKDLKLLNEQQKEKVRSDRTYSFAYAQSRIVEETMPIMLELVAVHRMRQIVLELAAIHQQGKAFPKSLEELQGVSVEDPLSGKPFGYSHTERSFQLSSVGRNGQADKGTKKSDDIVLAFP